MKKQNLAKGKKLSTPEDFANIFVELSLDNKTKVLGKLTRNIETGKSDKGKTIKESDMLILKGMSAWATMNIMVGNELYPASHITSDIDAYKNSVIL